MYILLQNYEHRILFSVQLFHSNYRRTTLHKMKSTYFITFFFFILPQTRQIIKWKNKINVSKCRFIVQQSIIYANRCVKYFSNRHFWEFSSSRIKHNDITFSISNRSIWHARCTHYLTKIMFKTPNSTGIN